MLSGICPGVSLSLQTTGYLASLRLYSRMPSRSVAIITRTALAKGVLHPDPRERQEEVQAIYSHRMVLVLVIVAVWCAVVITRAATYEIVFVILFVLLDPSAIPLFLPQCSFSV